MTANLPSEMNDQDIEMFIKAFDDFLQHAETEIDAHEKWKEAEEYTNQFFEERAAELEVTVDYYIQEFVEWISTLKNLSIWTMFYVLPILILLLGVANMLPPQ